MDGPSEILWSGGFSACFGLGRIGAVVASREGVHVWGIGFVRLSRRVDTAVEVGV